MELIGKVPVRARRGRPKLLTEEQIAEAANLRRAGTWSFQGLADRFGCSLSQIYNRIKKGQFPDLPIRAGKFDRLKQAELVDCYNHRLTHRQIAAKIGWTQREVGRRLSQLFNSGQLTKRGARPKKCSQKSVRRQSDEKRAEIAAYFLDKEPLRSIGELVSLPISHESVRQLLAEAGLNPETRRQLTWEVTGEVTIQEAAELLKVGITTVYVRVRNGTIQPSDRRPLRFTLAEVERLMEARQCSICQQPFHLKRWGNPQKTCGQPSCVRANTMASLRAWTADAVVVGFVPLGEAIEVAGVSAVMFWQLVQAGAIPKIGSGRRHYQYSRAHCQTVRHYREKNQLAVTPLRARKNS